MKDLRMEADMRKLTRPRGERGGALLLSVVISLVIVGLAGAWLAYAGHEQRQTVGAIAGNQALYIAEAAAADYIVRANVNPTSPPASSTGSFGGGAFTITTLNYGSDGVDNDGANGVDDDWEDRFMRLDVEGTYLDSRRRLQVILTRNPGGPLNNVVYAGNSSNDPDYVLTFGGTGGTHDIVRGDVYSGGGLVHANDAELLNTDASGGSEQVVYADSTGLDTSTSTQAPAPDYYNETQPALDVAAMNYDLKAAAAAAGDVSSPYFDADFVNVSDRIDSYGTDGYVLGETGPNQGCGVAKQIADQNDPAHIFRLDPKDNGTTDRVQSYSGMSTDKKDYFIEDPTRTKGSGSAGGNWLGSDGGQRINVQNGGNEKVYYLDGNLWASNSPAYTFQFENNTGTDMKMTFVVKGNVYLTDNLLYDVSKNNDALAIIAIEDPAFPNATPADYLVGGAKYDASKHTDQSYDKRQEYAREYNKSHGSGNIFFGDPGGGTTERFESFLYAQNNFYDHNLGSSGTNLTNIYGNMTAGNQVLVKRDPSAYKPMDITYDERLRNGSVSLPGLPANLSVAATDWQVVSWKPQPVK